MVNMAARQQDEEEDDDATEDGSKPPKIEIRLTAPSTGRTECLMNFEIRHQLHAAGAEINVNQPLPLVPSAQAMYEEEILEACMQIRYGNAHDTVREASIAFARNWCSNIGHGLHDAVRLEFLSPDSYYLRCKPEHERIAIASFSLGAFRNYGVFDDHFNMVGSPRQIRMGFEHDRKEMQLYCMYPLDVAPEHLRKPRDNGRPQQHCGLAMYRFTFNYPSIHSIVVDYGGEYGNASSVIEEAAGKEATVIYFRLKNPPKVDAGMAKPSSPRDARSMNLYESCMANPKGPYYKRQRCLPDFKSDQIGKCNVLKIILWPFIVGQRGLGPSVDDWHETVNEILSRVKTRSSCRVYYTGVRCMPARPTLPVITPTYLPSFKCYYLLHALISTRPYNIQDQVNEVFLNYVRRCVLQNERAAEIALSQLLAAADENRYFSVMNAFRKIFEVYVNEQACVAAAQNGSAPPSKQPKMSTTSVMPYGDDEVVAKNCVKVRKLIITPTRHMLLAPEVIVSNRVLRQFGEEYALRVVLRDEDGQKLQGARMDKDYFKVWIKGILLNDYVIGDRRYHFLSWSNSQLRDNGCYMYTKTADEQDYHDIRRWCGDFTAIQNVPKFMSRMGQCFTQAQTSIELPWSSGLIEEEDDIMGGDPHHGEVYNFSDGIGRISKKCAEEICQRLDVTPVRSAYQIRYGGFKGMLVVDPCLGTDPSGKPEPSGVQVMLRKSMHKFDSDKSFNLEIVKYSQPSAVYLNRPLVMILDQVSAKTMRSRKNTTAEPGENVHRRVCNRIHELLDDELFSMADMLLDEKASATALTTRTTLSIDFKRLKEAGFKLTTEPFFRGMLLAIHNYTIKQQLWKQKIEVSPDSGRTMYGVLDTTGLLQYGQVFVQYSKRLDKPGEDLQLVKGLVMVTKNPCIVPGDVRIFKAINEAKLAEHMHDVIVFPRNGPRPHTDEMAGSDLDGDEYSVYWDTTLMFHKDQVHEPVYFPKNPPEDVEGGIRDEDMVNFFCKYLQQDSIGKVCNAHLAFADRFGLFHKMTNQIAEKCSMAVDFPKTGHPAEPLTLEEQPSAWPDFFEKYHAKMYRSHRCVGKLYRRVKNASDIIRLGQDSISQPSLETNRYDYDLEVQGWELYKEDAVSVRNRYVQFLQALLDQYGVSDESSLISGHMVAIRNRLSDGEKEDFSFWNTEKIIELRLSKIFRKFRQRFFDEFGGERDEILEQPDEKVQQKASAWYMVTYGQQSAMRGKIMLSFPWMVWEILRYVKLRCTFQKYSALMDERVTDPTPEALTRMIEDYCSRNQDMVARLVSIVTTEEAEGANPHGKTITLYTQVYNPDFTNLLAVVLHWAEKELGFQKENSLKPIYIAQLLVEFCLNRQFIEPVEAIAQDEPSATAKRMVSKGHILLEYLKYLASFKHQESLALKLSATEATINLRRRQLRVIGQVAFKAYHHVAWTSHFDSLHLQSASRRARAALAWDREETEAVTVMFEETVTMRLQEEEVEKRLKAWSGVDDVRIRPKNSNKDPNEYLVTGAGTLEARQALQDILLAENLTDALVDNKNPLLEYEF